MIVVGWIGQNESMVGKDDPCSTLMYTPPTPPASSGNAVAAEVDAAEGCRVFGFCGFGLKEELEEVVGAALSKKKRC